MTALTQKPLGQHNTFSRTVGVRTNKNLSQEIRSKNKREKQTQQVRASSDNFDLGKYHEAVIGDIKADKHGHAVYLRLKDGSNSVLPVYIGEFECGALVKEITKKSTSRPGTHDLMKIMLEALGFRVSKVRITSLVGNTYHARVHFCRGKGIKDAQFAEVDIDARPSDAMNLAIRFGAAIYVNKEVAAKMSHPIQATTPEIHTGNAPGGVVPPNDAAGEILKTCREELMHYNDPTIMHKLQLQLAIAEERFEDASKIRDVIDRILASDRALALVVAIETALEDQRYEEAARLRDDFKAWRVAQDQETQMNITDALFGDA